MGSVIWANSNKKIGSIPISEFFGFLVQEGQATGISHFPKPGVSVTPSHRHETVHMGWEHSSRCGRSRLWESWWSSHWLPEGSAHTGKGKREHQRFQPHPARLQNTHVIPGEAGPCLHPAPQQWCRGSPRQERKLEQLLSFPLRKQNRTGRISSLAALSKTVEIPFSFLLQYVEELGNCQSHLHNKELNKTN